MKKLFLPLILLFTSSVYGQQIPPNETSKKDVVINVVEAETKDGKKVLLKSDGTWIFAVPSAPIQSPSPVPIKAFSPPLSATPEDVALFPKDYNGKLIKFSGLRIGSMEPYSEGNLNLFFLDVTSRDGKFFTNIGSPGSLNFVMSEDFARELQAEYHRSQKGEYTNYVVNALVKLKVANDDAGRNWILAAIRCIEFQSYSGKTSRSIGTCN